MDTKLSTGDMYIAKNCHINGEIKSSGNVTIDGQVEGTIHIKGDLIIGQEGKIKADIHAENIYIKGEANGKVMAKSLLEISSTGSLYGDVNTRFIKIEQGAKFIGTSTHLDRTETEMDNDSAQDKDSKDSKLSFKPIIYNRLVK